MQNFRQLAQYVSNSDVEIEPSIIEAEDAEALAIAILEKYEEEDVTIQELLETRDPDLLRSSLVRYKANAACGQIIAWMERNKKQQAKPKGASKKKASKKKASKKKASKK